MVFYQTMLHCIKSSNAFFKIYTFLKAFWVKPKNCGIVIFIQLRTLIQGALLRNGIVERLISLLPFFQPNELTVLGKAFATTSAFIPIDFQS